MNPSPFHLAMLAVSFAVAACRPEPPPTERPPVPQAEKHVAMRNAFRAPQKKVKVTAATALQAAEKQHAETKADQ